MDCFYLGDGWQLAYDTDVVSLLSLIAAYRYRKRGRLQLLHTHVDKVLLTEFHAVGSASH